MKSLPADFIAKMKALLGDEFEVFLHSYENHKFQALRFNPLKRGGENDAWEKIRKELAILDTVPVPWAKDAYYYEETAHPGKHPYHEAGVYYIQEPSAMAPAALLAPKPGERVLDLCAAPGGKSTQLASYLGQEGLLISNEIHPARCKILSQNIERMGICNAIVTNEDSKDLVPHFIGYFHKIMVDAPCSGEGMFRKNPDAMEEWSKEQVYVCANRQSMILHNASQMLMPGGWLAYSTCTFSPEENEDVIRDFLNRHEEFELLEMEAPYFDRGLIENTYRLFPHHLNGEGHFVALLHKKGQPIDAKEYKHLKKKSNTCLDKAQCLAFETFVEQTLSKQTMADFPIEQFTLFGDQLYCLPKGAPSLNGLHVLRAGIHLGTFKKNRFEPSHAFALALGKEDVQRSVSFSAKDARIAAYYRGETVCVQPGDRQTGNEKGWCLVCVDGYSAGWGKLAGNQLKNHYPKGLRKEFMTGKA